MRTASSLSFLAPARVVCTGFAAREAGLRRTCYSRHAHLFLLRLGQFGPAGLAPIEQQNVLHVKPSYRRSRAICSAIMMTLETQQFGQPATRYPMATRRPVRRQGNQRTIFND